MSSAASSAALPACAITDAMAVADAAKPTRLWKPATCTHGSGVAVSLGKAYRLQMLQSAGGRGSQQPVLAGVGQSAVGKIHSPALCLPTPPLPFQPRVLQPLPFILGPSPPLCPLPLPSLPAAPSSVHTHTLPSLPAAPSSLHPPPATADAATAARALPARSVHTAAVAIHAAAAACCRLCLLWLEEKPGGGGFSSSWKRRQAFPAWKRRQAFPLVPGTRADTSARHLPPPSPPTRGNPPSAGEHISPLARSSLQRPSLSSLCALFSRFGC
eukprot:67869-Chlamydomonas_euryale.AAC.1